MTVAATRRACLGRVLQSKQQAEAVQQVQVQQQDSNPSTPSYRQITMSTC